MVLCSSSLKEFSGRFERNNEHDITKLIRKFVKNCVKVEENFKETKKS